MTFEDENTHEFQMKPWHIASLIIGIIVCSVAILSGTINYFANPNVGSLTIFVVVIVIFLVIPVILLLILYYKKIRKIKAQTEEDKPIEKNNNYNNKDC